jgi:hypothetical protein
MRPSLASFLLFPVHLTSETAMLTTRYLRTRGSLLVAVLAHLTFNTSETVVLSGVPMLAVEQQRSVYLVNVAVLAALGLAGLPWGRRRPNAAPAAYPPQEAAGKIAFNYLAFREAALFVLSPAFDPIRTFIRNGVIPAPAPILTSDGVPFRFDNAKGERPVVHFVGIAKPHEGHSTLLALVSLFGLMTHTIILAHDFAGPWPASHVYLYNPKDRRVRPWFSGFPFVP